MAETIRWGVLGTGYIAGQFTIDAGLSQTGRVVAVASRNPDRAAAFAGRHGVATAHGSYEALVADPGVDAVYIATPNALHRDHALLAIGAGKAVLCEKPFALTATEAREIREASRAAGVFCMEAMWTRFLPAMQALKNQVDSGAIGRPILLRAELGFPIARQPGDRFSDPALGAGVLHDLGIYGVSMAHWLLGEIGDVTAQARRDGHGVDSEITAQCRHGARPDAPLSTVIASHSAQLSNTLEVVGESGRITVEAPFVQAMQTRLRSFYPGAMGTPTPDGKAKDLLKRTGLWPHLRPVMLRWLGRDGALATAGFRGNGYQFEIDEVGRCLVAGLTESPQMTLDQSVAVMAALDRIATASA
ncbi:MAG: Gfo/Idh/MocA family oxidoreductase [Pseudomonadota bacterium]